MEEGSKKSSESHLNEMVKNLTSEMNDTDGQYIPLGITTPPATHWTPAHNYLPPYVSDLNDPYLNSRSTTLGAIIPPSRGDLSDGNFVNMMYPQSHHMSMYLQQQQQQQQQQQNMMNNFYRDHDFGLYMNPPSQSIPQTTQQQQPQANIIENLVCNWTTSAGTGTYSPFGNTLLDPPTTTSTAAPIQPQPLIEERAVPKKRIVAEVRPMRTRPSYSDIVSKSPPTKPRNLSPNITKSAEIPIVKPIKPIAKVAKTVSGKKASSTGIGGGNVKRQHSNEDHKRNHSPAPIVITRRISLDSMQADDEDRPDSSQDSSSQSGDNFSKPTKNKSRSARASSVDNTPLNNHKLSKPGATKRPLHINNNLNPPPSSSVKNMVKGGRPCKTCGEERRGGTSGSGSTSKSEGKTGQKARSSSQGRDKNGSRKNKTNKKKLSPYSFSALWQLVQNHLMQWITIVIQAVIWFLHLLYDVLGMSSNLTLHFCESLYKKMKAWSKDGWIYIRAYLPFVHNQQQQQQQQHRKSKHRGSQHTNVSPPPWWSRWLPSWFPWFKKKTWDQNNEGSTKLSANLPLPATGEEAMKRLLACRGKDPYSILGVAPNCTDEDIKKYYKRQAFLVHPDKNNQPGAEEAFKILVHAFELIGEPEKRLEYDAGLARSQQKGAEWSELNDLLAQLHQKMEEAANTIRCTNCGNRHKRVPVDRPPYAARDCAQCKIKHAAREGDIWAESTMLGFLWHYYACMEGAIYDITEWAACQSNNLKHLRANTHAVQYRIVLGKKNQGNHNKRPSEQPSEPDLEDFLNSLYGQQSTSGGTSTRNMDNDSPQRHSTSTDQARKRKGKRKK